MASATREGKVCTICGNGKLVVINRGDNAVQYRCDICGGLFVDAYGTLAVSAAPSRVKARSGLRIDRPPPKTGSDPAKEIDHRITKDSNVRYVKDRTGGKKAELQVAWHKDGTLKHVDCKRCDNKWYLADGNNLADYFEKKDDSIRCKKCGLEVSLSAV